GVGTGAGQATAAAAATAARATAPTRRHVGEDSEADRLGVVAVGLQRERVGVDRGRGRDGPPERHLTVGVSHLGAEVDRGRGVHEALHDGPGGVAGAVPDLDLPAVAGVVLDVDRQLPLVVTVGVGALGVGALGVGALGVGALGLGALRVGALGVGARGRGALGVGAAGLRALGVRALG